jgi:hypothetical protein
MDVFKTILAGIVPINAYQIQAYTGPQLFHFDCGDQQECHYQEPEPRNQNNESTKTSTTRTRSFSTNKECWCKNTRCMSTGPPFLVATIGRPYAATWQATMCKHQTTMNKAGQYIKKRKFCNSSNLNQGEPKRFNECTIYKHPLKEVET